MQLKNRYARVETSGPCVKINMQITKANIAYFFIFIFFRTQTVIDFLRKRFIFYLRASLLTDD